MIKKFIHLLAIPSILLLGACATTKTAQQIDQNDDVYYSVAQAKEEAEVVQQQPKAAEVQNSDYVTNDELYGDAYGNDYYEGDYSSRIYRFRNYSPWRNYYDSWYNNGFDPYYNNSFYSYNYYNGPGFGINIGIGNGYYNNYNPWRYYGYNYSGNYWGPYSYYNTYNPYGIGYGGGYGGGYYGGNYGNNPVYSSPNYRPRPARGIENIGMDRGGVIGGSGSIIKDGNGNVIQTRGRAERYGDNVSSGTNPSTPRTSGTRTQTTAPRPERVSQSQPQRATQPSRTSTTPQQSSPPPSNNTSGGSRSSGGDSSSPRPSRGN